MKRHFYSSCKVFLFLIWTISALDPKNTEIEYKEKNKSVLNVLELLDLLSKENRNVSSNRSHSSKDSKDNKLDKHLLDTEELEITTAKNCEDKDTLKMRKVWSRWSKWSPCSVTCGVGTITRRRECVSGRCAPGEREEQRRACSRSPCEVEVVPDDMRDSE